jgi:hypothetical protein
MPTINQLPTASSLSSSDQIPVYSSSNGDARKASLTTLRTWFEDNFASPEFETVLEAPTGSGFNIQLAASTENIWLIANPTGAFAAGTVTLPPVADCFDGQQIIVTCSQAVTALTVAGNGATIVGAPTALGTGGFFSLRFRESQDTWYCTSQSLGGTDVFTGDVTVQGDLILSGDVLVAAATPVLKFVEEGSSPAPGENNEITIVYSENGSKVGLVATGESADIDLVIQSKGTTGSITLNGGNSAGAVTTVEAHSVDIICSSTGTVDIGGGGDVAITTQAAGANVSISSDSGNVTLTALGGNVNVPSSLVLTDSVTFPVSTITNLPSPPVQGMRAIVTNANATTFHSVVAAGGANVVPVFYDGTNWRIG